MCGSISVSALWLMSAPAIAQTVLSEAAALARLSPDSPRVRAIQRRSTSPRRTSSPLSRWPNPRFTYDRESVAGVTEGMTMVTQPLPISGRRGLETSAANALVDAASQRAGDEMRRARADLIRIRGFAGFTNARARNRSCRDRLQELSGVLQRREAAGDAAGFDRLRAEREVLELEADLVSAAVERARAQSVLAAFFPGPVDRSTIVAAEAIAFASCSPAVDACSNVPQTIRGELFAFDREIEAAQFSYGQPIAA